MVSGELGLCRQIYHTVKKNSQIRWNLEQLIISAQGIVKTLTFPEYDCPGLTL